MNTKLLLLLGAVVGLLLIAVLGIAPGDGDDKGEVEGQLVDAGHFVLDQADVRILDETYELYFHPADGYMLVSEGVLTVSGQEIDLGQQAQYDRDFHPFFYQLAAETPSATQIISAQMGLSGLTMEVRVGSARQSAQIADTGNLALLDNNVISQYVVLWAAIRNETLDRAFTAAVPQALLSLPAKAEGPNRTRFRSADRSYDGKTFTVFLGDTEIVLVEYDGRLVGLVNRTQGTVAYDVDRFPDGITLEPAAAAEEDGTVSEDVTFVSGDLVLAGTLTRPQSAASSVPAALFVAGSGPVDRDGNAAGLKMDAYRQIANALAQQGGIASLRYDKRGVGASEGVFESASRDDLLSDLHAALEFLRSQPGIDPSRVFLIGHSEGAYLAPLLAAETPDVAGVVLLEGAARSLADITRWQVETMLEMQGATQEQIAAGMAQEDQYIEFVKQSTGEWSDYSLDELQAAMPLFSAPALEQLQATPLSLTWLRQYYTSDPAEILQRVNVPVLVINGRKDLQVPSSEADLIRSALEEGGNQAVTVEVFDDLNHLLRYHPEAPSLTYRHLDEAVDPRVLEAIVNWARDVFGGS